MTEELAIYQTIPQQAATDTQLIEMWLHDRPVNTVKAYRQHIGKFYKYVERWSPVYKGVAPVRYVTLGLLQEFQINLKESGLRDKSVQCHMSTIKSLFTFAQRIGYIQFNPAAVIKLRQPKDTLAQRLLDRATVIKMVDAEKNPRNRALMRLLYVSGIRSSEAINLCGKDLMAHDTGGGQITVTAKGDKTLAVWIDATTWQMLGDLPWSEPEHSIFHTESGRKLHLNHVLKIVRAAAKRVGINKPVSPHWLRHATATHLMDAGVSLVAIKEHLGHETIQTTTRYTHVKPSAANAKLLAW